ncbi:MAG: AIR synthase family protein [Clostridiales bacterium]|nr:AIR synthase family protein [Clostridiales bacterium]
MMQIGKASYNVLKRSILRPIHTRGNQILRGSGIGIDSSALQTVEGGAFAMATANHMFHHSPEYVVYRVLNDLAASGAKLEAIQISLTIPVSMSEQALALWMKEIEQTCSELDVTITGGHTTVSKAVTMPILSVTGAGKQCYFTPQKAKPGMDLIMTKYTGIEGTVFLATEKEEQLHMRYTYDFIHGAKWMRTYLSAVPEAAVAGQHGVMAMHNVSEGGVLGALWEMTDGANVGMELDFKQIPIRQQTVEICEFFGLNPYQLLSGGSMLMAAEDGNAVVRVLEKEGIAASVIGVLTDKNERILWNGEERRYLDRPQPDEIYKIIGY